MKPWLTRVFIDNWPRKVLSLIIAIGIWLIVNQSLTTKKDLSNIPIHIVNLPPGKTVEGMQPNGLLHQRLSVKLRGNKTVLEDLTSSDLIIEIDASGKEGEWVETITKRNLVSLNPSINISQGISEMNSKNVIVKLSKLVTEKIPVIITQPIGEPPKGYQYLDIWPYRLWITVSGPEETLKAIKTRGVKLTFNLNDISKADLDDLKTSGAQTTQDAVSYFVPNSWKQVYLSALSDVPVEINDPNAKLLRIDFIRYELVQIESGIPVNLYFPPKPLSIQPQKVQVQPNDLVKVQGGIKVIDAPLYAKGVSKRFIEAVRNMVEVLVIVDPRQGSDLATSIQFINPNELEDRYVHTSMSDALDDEVHDLQPQVREELLRNRFRNYMNRFRLFTEGDKPLNISAQLQGNAVVLTDES